VLRKSSENFSSYHKNLWTTMACAERWRPPQSRWDGVKGGEEFSMAELENKEKV
jgi:hypothetical protein